MWLQIIPLRQLKRINSSWTAYIHISVWIHICLGHTLLGEIFLHPNSSPCHHLLPRVHLKKISSDSDNGLSPNLATPLPKSGWPSPPTHTASPGHYSDVIMSTMASKWPASWLFAQPFVQPQTKENSKALRHWPLWGEFADDRWIPRTKGQ